MFGGKESGHHWVAILVQGPSVISTFPLGWFSLGDFSSMEETGRITVLTATQAAGIIDLASLQEWSGASTETWNAVNLKLGAVRNLLTLSFIPPSAMHLAIRDARIATAAVGEDGTPDYQPPGVRSLTPAEATQVGLMYQGAQQLAGKPLVDPNTWEDPASRAPLAVGFPPMPAGGLGGPMGPGPASPGEGKRKVKCSQVLDQTDEAEVPELAQGEVDKYYRILEKVKGGPVRPEAEPTPDQISALKVRVMDLLLSPYADFSIFVNFQHRFSKTLKFLNHILQPDGTFKAVEVPGPPNYDQWLSSWKVFENTLLMFEVGTRAGSLPVATPSSLEEYKDSFRDLVLNYPESWHLLVTAEDRCRCEHFPRLRRKYEELSRRGLAPDFQEETPWDFIFRAAARDREYWDKHVREPALLFRTSGMKRKEQPGGTGSGTDHTGDSDKGPSKKKKSKGQKERLKRQLADLRKEKGQSSDRNNEREDMDKRDKGRGPKRDGRGRFITDRQGKQICFAFNNGECKGVCPKGMTHVCQICLGTHPAKGCKKPPNN